MLVAHFAAGGSGALSVPSWALAYAVFAVSVIAILISRSRHVPRPRPRAGERPETAPEATGVHVSAAQAIAGVVLIASVGFCWFGPAEITRNIAPLLLIGVLWPLGGWVALVFGWCWEAVDPFTPCGRWGDRRRQRHGLAAPRIPTWAPVPVFASWVVVWVAWIRGDEPRNLAIWLSGYVVVLVYVAVRGGTTAARVANPLPAALDLAAGIFRQRRSDERTPRATDRSRVALIAAMLMGALGANRAAGAAWFTSRFGDDGSFAATVATFGAFVLLSVIVAAVWWACNRFVESGRSETGTRPIAAALGPAAGGLLLAQGFPVGLIAAQNLIIVASDPFGQGWNLFGTAYWQVSPDPLSGFTRGLIQTGAILAGQCAALVMIGRTATARSVDGATSPAARNRAWNAALGAMAVITCSGIGWTWALVGR